jgi:hypothetical protein
LAFEGFVEDGGKKGIEIGGLCGIYLAQGAAMVAEISLFKDFNDSLFSV